MFGAISAMSRLDKSKRFFFLSCFTLSNRSRPTAKAKLKPRPTRPDLIAPLTAPERTLLFATVSVKLIARLTPLDEVDEAPSLVEPDEVDAVVDVAPVLRLLLTLLLFELLELHRLFVLLNCGFLSVLASRFRSRSIS